MPIAAVSSAGSSWESPIGVASWATPAVTAATTITVIKLTPIVRARPGETRDRRVATRLSQLDRFLAKVPLE